MENQLEKFEEVKESLPKSFNPLQAKKEQLLSESTNLVISDSSSYQVVRGLRTSIQKVVTMTKEIKKEIKAPILELADQAESIAKDIIDPLEERKAELIEKIKAWDDRIAEEKRLAEEKERERIQKLQNAIIAWANGISSTVQSAQSSGDIDIAINEFSKPMSPEWAEFEEFYLEKRESIKEEIRLQRDRIREIESLRKEKEARQLIDQAISGIDEYYNGLISKIDNIVSNIDDINAIESNYTRLVVTVDNSEVIEHDVTRHQHFINYLAKAKQNIIDRNELEELRKKKAEMDKIEAEKRQKEEEAKRIQDEKDAKKKAELEAAQKAKEKLESVTESYVSMFKKKPTKDMSIDDMVNEISIAHNQKKEEEKAILLEIRDFMIAVTTESHNNFISQMRTVKNVPESFANTFAMKRGEFLDFITKFNNSLMDLIPDNDDKDSSKTI